ncbi:MATE family efflux transporter [Umboniibacter marinipuniceus]|uniref:Putative MATE family efflux protein n=1 Tax=Umboniibacter marinipuniceus TaxID=569599 RepID=A0A3L9ZY56_9GAMM|nr:MATE family efflux transporter [Umboniibacter marinipuniceus]RMA77653.1 putative MATE family efflux protein [Umboniibacter marinipuniceus]
MAKKDFTQGNVLNHILVMSATSTVGLLAIFGVDLTDLIFLSQLGDHDILAAIGFAGVILFFTQSIGIGLSVAMLALVSKAIGQANEAKMKATASNIMLFSSIVAVAIALVTFPLLDQLLAWLGATGRAAELAYRYSAWLLPFFPVMVIATSANAIVRALGDAKRAMSMMLAGALVNLILDPIFIFYFEWGIEGAAMASAAARVTMACFALYAVLKVHPMLARINWQHFRAEAGMIARFALPTTLTNFATPIGMALLTYKLAEIGTTAVAGSAIISKITPVAFAVFYSLSGAVGPIIGQNVGAGQYPRVIDTLKTSVKFSCAYTAVLWLLMVVSLPYILMLFGAEGQVAEVVSAFCYFAIPLTCAMGALFVANAGFNNMGRPGFATAANFLRNSLGVIPFVWLGAEWFGAEGAIVGFSLGGFVFGVLAIFYCIRLAKSRLERQLLAEMKDAN